MLQPLNTLALVEEDRPIWSEIASVQDEPDANEISCGTLNALVTAITSVKTLSTKHTVPTKASMKSGAGSSRAPVLLLLTDPAYEKAFLLTYQSFTTPFTLLEKFIQRYPLSSSSWLSLPLLLLSLSKFP